MKRVRLLGNQKLVVEETAKPRPKADEVLIRTSVSALCGSEMNSYRKEGVADGNIGHEAAGIICEIGPNVTGVSVGDRVGVSAIAGCGACDYCSDGQYTWCDQFRFYGNMHAEYFVVAALACHKLPDDVPWDAGVLITGDGLGVPFHSAKIMDKPNLKTIAVFGLGPIGLGTVLFQAHLGKQIIGIDRSPVRLALAERLGAGRCINADETKDVTAEIRRLTSGKGADVCVEAAGIPLTVKQSFASVRKGGIVVFNGEQPSVELSPSDDFIRRDITATGSWFYHFNEYAGMLEAYRSGLKAESLITHRFSVNEAEEAYRVMHAGKSGKVLLSYEPQR